VPRENDAGSITVTSQVRRWSVQWHLQFDTPQWLCRVPHMSSGKSGKPLTDFGGLYLPSERIPAAKPIVEDSSESLWAEFNKVSAQQEGKFAPTEVVSLEETARMELAQPAARRAQAPIEIGDVLIEARRGNRVCPKSPQ
jgi:hypothetical protein